MNKLISGICILGLVLVSSSCKKQEVFRQIDGPQTAFGYQDYFPNTGDTVIQADPIVVDSRGITIIQTVLTNADSCWINLEISPGGAQNAFANFLDKDKILNFKITKKGTYFIYPQIKPGAKHAEIKVTYTVP